MSDNCQLVVFSNKAYNAIIRESFDKDPVETGGILLGHVLDNGVWVVMEVLPPGINCIFETAYFEYDEEFVNYLAQSVANQYKKPLDLLGLWHRHPGSMDFFSSTDDSTNATFALQNPRGVISGLVNIDPRFRLTMYHMDCPDRRWRGRPDYEMVDIEVGDDIIPEEFFALRYYDGEGSDLNPLVQHSPNRIHRRPLNSKTSRPEYQNESNRYQGGSQEPLGDADGHPDTNSVLGTAPRIDAETYEMNRNIHQVPNRQASLIDDLTDLLQALKKKWRATLVIAIALTALLSAAYMA